MGTKEINTEYFNKEILLLCICGDCFGRELGERTKLHTSVPIKKTTILCNIVGLILKMPGILNC